MTENYTTEDYISVRQAAAQCGKNPETIRRWIWSGKLSARKLGNQLFIKKEALIGVCRETAVEYKAEPTPEFMESESAFPGGSKTRGVIPASAENFLRHVREERMNTIEESMRGREAEIKKVEDWLKRAKDLRDRMRARGVKPMDSVDLIQKMREERMDEIEQSLR
jgi:excisionase family DNA binding protein